MPRPNWRNIIIFKTAVTLLEGDFQNLHLFLKVPPSDHRQKIEYLGSNRHCNMTSERWSNLCKFDIPSSDFDNDNEIDLNVILNMDVPRSNPYRLSRNETLAELEELWQESPHVNDYLQPDNLVEIENEELTTQTHEIVSDSMKFWDAVRTIAQWINSHIVYVYEMQNLPYQGAAKTLQTRRAICSDFVHLFLAMTRIKKIPSRAIIGFYKQKRSEPWNVHSWSEVYDPNYGWTPLDLTIQPINIANLGQSYIRVTAGYNCEERFYAFYTSPKDESHANINLKQYVRIGNDIVEISFFR